MPFSLTDVRNDLDNLLATAVDVATWTQAMKDEAVRQALRLYNLRGPSYEVDLTVTTAGREQDLSAIPELMAIDTIAWPWVDGLLLEDQAVRFRKIGPTTVRMDGASPAEGDTLRVRYRRAHTVNGLDGATTTTVADAHRAVLAVGAAAALTALRRRQIGENPAVPHEAREALAAAGEGFEQRFLWLLDRLAGEVHGPVWTQVGL
jgi:hypothetical protein